MFRPFVYALLVGLLLCGFVFAGEFCSTRLYDELAAAGLSPCLKPGDGGVFCGVDATGRISWCDGHPTDAEKATAEAVLKAHDPTPAKSKLDPTSALLLRLSSGWDKLDDATKAEAQAAIDAGAAAVLKARAK